MSLENNSFKHYIFNTKRNITILKIAAAAIVIQFSIFKYFYPYASFIHGDSFCYLEGARQNLDINTYLIGYSKFLRLFSVFSKSDTVLVAFQYLLIQTSALFFLFTISYFYQLSKASQIILWSFIVLNPLFLHLANLISSDGFFLFLSLAWFSTMIWIIYRPSIRWICLHALFVFLAFTVRYNALIYPVVSLLAFWLSTMSLKRKVIGWGVAVLLCTIFFNFTMSEYKRITGIYQYSPFSGWQLANNALYAYRFVKPTERLPVFAKFMVLDSFVRSYIDTTRDLKKFNLEKSEASSVYMWWEGGSPLYAFRNHIYKGDTVTTDFQKWAAVGPFLKDYGLHIIKTYPGYYFQHFAWPNAKKYYAPPVEFLHAYNSGRDTVMNFAQRWFEYRTQKVWTRMSKKNVWVLNYYPILSGIINVVMLASLICYLMLKGWQLKNQFNKGIAIGALLWLLNASFTIFASSAALRFQSFPIILTTTFTLLLVDWIIKFSPGILDKQSITSRHDCEQVSPTW
jgi:hypothetical protein